VGFAKANVQAFKATNEALLHGAVETVKDPRKLGDVVGAVEGNIALAAIPIPGVGEAGAAGRGVSLAAKAADRGLPTLASDATRLATRSADPAAAAAGHAGEAVVEGGVTAPRIPAPSVPVGEGAEVAAAAPGVEAGAPGIPRPRVPGDVVPAEAPRVPAMAGASAERPGGHVPGPSLEERAGTAPRTVESPSAGDRAPSASATGSSGRYPGSPASPPRAGGAEPPRLPGEGEGVAGHPPRDVRATSGLEKAGASRAPGPRAISAPPPRRAITAGPNPGGPTLKQVRRNPVRGPAGEDHIASGVEAPLRQVHLKVPAGETPLGEITGSGGRKVDVAEVYASGRRVWSVEVKNYAEWTTVGGKPVHKEVGLNSELKQQVLKDAWLRDNWTQVRLSATDPGMRAAEFYEPHYSFVGASPNEAYRDLLKRAGIPWTTFS